ncbi:MAG: outer membrane protein TolC [Bacteroidia bacterium]|jgi:outer membrane protein TolC
MKRVLSSIVILWTAATSLLAQLPDTLIFNESSFLKQALDYAPAIKNAQLEVSIQNQEFLAAKGAFEPKIGGKYSVKEFDSKNYYNKQQTRVQVKTPIGIRIDGGLLSNDGIFLNPESNVPSSGLVYAGIEVPLGAGMFTDADRTYLKQQRLENDAASLGNTLSVNDYLLEAGEQYWDWYESIMLLRISEEAVLLASSRLKFIKRKNSIGEAADIDTLEAFINFQNRTAYYIANLIKYQKSSNYIQNYIWMPDRAKGSLAPEVDLDYDAIFPDSILEKNFVYTHPIIRLLETDSLINLANIILAKEYFKPQVDVAFRLQESANTISNFNYDITNNHYVGINLKMPLFLRKERANSKQLSYKGEIISNKKFEMLAKIENAQKTYYYNSIELKKSVALWKTASINYGTLLAAEQTKLTLGESSLFVVNNRELKWIDAREKYINNYVEYRKAILGYYYSLVLLPEIL